jgi:hypothetical protein
MPGTPWEGIDGKRGLMGLFGLNIGEGPISVVIPPGGNELGSEKIQIIYLLMCPHMKK